MEAYVTREEFDKALKCLNNLIGFLEVTFGMLTQNWNSFQYCILVESKKVETSLISFLNSILYSWTK